MKKVFALFVILSLMISCVLVFADGYSGDLLNDYKKEAVTLIDLGIITDYTINEYDPYNYIPNRELIDMIGNFVGYGEIGDYKSYATELTANVGMEEFQEYTYPTVEFAVSMVLGALGYNKINGSKDYKEKNSIISQGKQIGLLKGLNYTTIKSLRRGEAIKIIYNMLEAPVLQFGNLQGNNVTYTKSDDTAIYCYKKIYKITDIVAAAGFTAMYGESSLSSNSVIVGSKTYRSNKSFNDYVGIKCDVYISEVNGSVISVYPDRNCKILFIKAEDFADYDVIARKFTYYQNNGSRNVSLEKSVAVIKNGFGLKSFDKSSFDISSGTLELYDNDSNGKYDVVIINSAEFFVVDRISDMTKTIYNKITFDPAFKSIKLDNEDSNKIILIYKDGVVADFSDIKPNDVLELYYNPTAVYKTIRINICGSSIYGTVEAFSEEEIKISGKQYKVSKNYIKAKNNNDKYAPSLDGNTSYRFYLNGNEELVAVEKNYLQENKTAYLYKVAKRRDDYLIQVFTEDGEWKRFYLAEKVRYGGSRKKAEDIYTSLDSLTGQIIRYKINSEEKITEVIYAVDYSYASADDFSVIGASDRYYRGGKIPSLDNTYYFDEYATVFSVPTDGNSEKFQVVGKSSLIEYKTYNVEMYDVNEYNIAKYFVINMSDSATANNLATGTTIIVEKSSTVLNADEDIVTKISGPSGSMTKFSICISQDAIEKKIVSGSVVYTKEHTSIDKGDVIRFITDKTGNISCYEILSTASDTSGYIPSTLFDKGTYLKGKIKKLDLDLNAIMLDIDGTLKPVIGNNTTKIYVVKKNDKTILKGNMSDIEPNDRALIIYPNGFVNMVVLYKD